MRAINHFAASILTALLTFDHACAVSAFKINSQQQLDLAISTLQAELQQSKPDETRARVDTEILADGVNMDPEAFVSTVQSVIIALAGQRSSVRNPASEFFGPLWDFEILDREFQYRGDSCYVSCRFRVFAAGPTERPGQFAFVRQNRGWRLCALNGLFPFLQELTETNKNRQSEAAQKEQNSE